MKLYHFCVMRQHGQTGSFMFADGTVSANYCLSDNRQYHELKTLIAGTMGEACEASDLVLLSLTVLDEMPSEAGRGEGQ